MGAPIALREVWHNVVKMLRYRGYDVAPAAATPDWTREDAEREKKSNGGCLLECKRERDARRIAVFPCDGVVKVGFVRQVRDWMTAKKIENAIILCAVRGSDSFARKELAQYGDRTHIELFYHADFVVCLAEHVLVPRHWVLTAAERDAEMRRHSLKAAEQSQLQPTDPLVRYYDLRRGDMVKSFATNNVSEGRTVYRVVA